MTEQDSAEQDIGGQDIGGQDIGGQDIGDARTRAIQDAGCAKRAAHLLYLAS
jgi:hypothetical protein